MGESAIKVARAVDYVGAGTVEFLVSDETREFYFLEMNTRLQVEHPVTELVTGIDLVREQICVAFGEKLSFAQDEIEWKNHSIECRVYAEDPENNFLPSPGKITRLRVPQGNGVRDDGGVYEGAEVSIYYDPMISKLAVYGKTREEAIDRLRRALREYEVGGIKTTIPFFQEIVEDEEFIAGNLDTGFINRFNERKKEREVDETTRDLALIATVLAQGGKQESVPKAAEQAFSRWAMAGRLASHQNRL
jgi:acetyl-CoA carboxylase biotin carboxylase subunit